MKGRLAKQGQRRGQQQRRRPTRSRRRHCTGSGATWSGRGAQSAIDKGGGEPQIEGADYTVEIEKGGREPRIEGAGTDSHQIEADRIARLLRLFGVVET